MRLGIIGLASSGKTTLFQSLIGRADAGDSKGKGGARSQIGVVKVPDPRLATLHRLFPESRIVPAAVEFVDVAGGVSEKEKEREKRSSSEGQVMAQLREMDGLVLVLRAFRDPSVPHPSDRIDPAKDHDEMVTGLKVADLESVEGRQSRLRKKEGRGITDAEKRELALLDRIAAWVGEGRDLIDLPLKDEEKKLVRGFQFFTLKPRVTVVNVDESEIGSGPLPAIPGEAHVIGLCAKVEREIAELPVEERREFLKAMGVEEEAAALLIRECYRAMGLRSFFTIGPDETRAWTFAAGDNAVAAAGKVHSDIARGFIRAEVVAYDDLVRCGSEKEAKAKGLYRLEGKEYLFRDGDVTHFKFSV